MVDCITKRAPGSFGLRSLVLVGGMILPCGNALANGLYENRSWQFQTSADKANNAFVRDMIERKNGGFYDSSKTIVNNTNNYTTNVSGDQVNCNLATTAVGSQSASAMDSVNSSPNVSSGSDIDVAASGNEGLNSGDGESALSSRQRNSGDQSASVSDLNSTTGSVSGSNGTTSQALNNTQNNSGSQQASVTGSEVCAFAGSKGGAGAPLN